MSVTKLSVNINKIATLRNARGGNMPDVEQAALDCISFGAQGITVHPRPDGRHIRYSDVRALKPLLDGINADGRKEIIEFNIEGNPTEDFTNLVLEVKPDQVTMVPDAHDAITSNQGWDCLKNRDFLTEICRKFKAAGIRTSIFIDPIPDMAAAAADCGADRIELYTEAYSRDFDTFLGIGKSNCSASGEFFGEEAIRSGRILDCIRPYLKTAEKAREYGLAINAGHDLNLKNLAYFVHTIPWTAEVSIGHAIICDALYMGLERTISKYLEKTGKID